MRHKMGATLEQLHGDKWLPIAFASRTMTSAEQNYSQLEKETLSIVFGCSKFHEYLYGRKFIIENDHKPLMSIFKKPFSKTPPRIQRFILHLQKYDFELIYIPGKDMILSDTLSRASLPTTKQDLINEEITSYIHCVLKSIPIVDKKIEEIKVETEKDITIQKVMMYLRNGWPKHKKMLPIDVRPYFTVQDALSTTDGLLLKDSRIVIHQ